MSREGLFPALGVHVGKLVQAWSMGALGEICGLGGASPKDNYDNRVTLEELEARLSTSH